MQVIRRIRKDKEPGLWQAWIRGAPGSVPMAERLERTRVFSKAYLFHTGIAVYGR